MDIVINLTPIEDFLHLPPDLMLWKFFLYFGWIILAWMFVKASLHLWLIYIETKWSMKNKFILLAIDIPKGNEQSPKATENLFTYLAGAHGSVSFFEKWFLGVYQLSFSFEIVSIDGYTQFLIRTPIQFRSLVESSVYSQYPDAEITEVDDYVEGMPLRFPDEEYDIAGSEFIQQKHFIYPIKTYKEFEHQMGPSETQFKDPMASLMDLCSSLRTGEQFWYQILVTPCGFDWAKKADDEVNKILGKKPKAGEDLLDRLAPIVHGVSEGLFELWGPYQPEKKEEKKALSMMELTPVQKKKIEFIQNKASQLGFEAKLRIVYLAKKDVINKAKVFSGFVGYIKQFIDLDLNSFKPDLDFTMTKSAYFNQTARLITKKNRLMNNYVGRAVGAGRTPGVYTIEELATIWHFPIEASVKAPLVQMAPGRKAEAPASLPLFMDDKYVPEDIFNEKPKGPKAPDDKIEALEKDNPPENLPFA
ncbi:MAG: hypothetical protein NT165_03055 [Candidatus Falkowbacteria bacterium]|nr:hypothetical protein [Candidatus Falkowbacteria bacterium]